MFISLVYLARQIRQGNTLARRGENNMTYEQTSVFRRSIALDAGIAELWIKGSEHYDLLSQVEKLRFDSLAADNFWNIYQIWDRARHGVLASEDWERTERGAVALLRKNGLAQWWSRNKVQYPNSFVRELDDPIRSEDTCR